MARFKESIRIVGAGLAGSECAYQLAEKGYCVQLIEMRPQQLTPAHKTGLFAELVCSNSLGSQTDYSAPGQLKWEAEQLNSLILKCGQKSAIPAGMALGVDREHFSQALTTAIKDHPRIEVCEEIFLNDLESIQTPTVIATGPLTHLSLAKAIQKHFDNEFLYFYDAIAPIIDTESIDLKKVFRANRFEEGEGDYLNCPLDKEQYYKLIESIKAADKVETKEFEKTPYFDGCMPIEAIVERGDETLRFGPMSPKGLPLPETGKRAYAIVQLRQENKDATAYNMVGFQTKMTYGSQKEILRQIPGLENADFLKLGSIHRNLYIHSPKVLTPSLQSRKNPNVFFAGQITGVEGYFESAAVGLMVSYFVDAFVQKKEFCFPRESAFGSLINAITEEKTEFQPTNINFSLFPPLDATTLKGRKNKRERRDQQIARAKKSFEDTLGQVASLQDLS